MFFRTSKVKPFGCRGKIILAPEGFGIFPANLACTEHELLKPVVTGTPAPKAGLTKIKCYVTEGKEQVQYRNAQGTERFIRP
ncbi:hypothetical protein BACDOR_02983 [Phocaeicola dorei DSM 17855]|uniref:Uncharacterized protein n=1 Tax=Phocaeicola dorei DSM 17855 TaxID=483217 RepID=B6W0A3_9BACT|nr:hypothetical protein BACDOR_02983 [Phocaeicola dorei DSM 17855]